MAEHYERPGWFTKHVFNPVVAGLTRVGISVAGSRVLEVTGRSSGETRRTPVNLLKLDGERYLVAPRGQTQWVKNVRVKPEARLIAGWRSQPIRLEDIPDDRKPPIVRAYLKRWKWEVGVFLVASALTPGEDELLRIAPDHPVFGSSTDSVARGQSSRRL